MELVHELPTPRFSTLKRSREEEVEKQKEKKKKNAATNVDKEKSSSRSVPASPDKKAKTMLQNQVASPLRALGSRCPLPIPIPVTAECHTHQPIKFHTFLLVQFHSTPPIHFHPTTLGQEKVRAGKQSGSNTHSH